MHEQRDNADPEERRVRRYVIEVGLADGRTLTDEVDEAPGTLTSFVQLHQRLATEPVALISERLLVRREEVRYVRIGKAKA